jgi:ribonuclease HI
MKKQKKNWKLYFDDASSREGSGEGIVLISPTQQVVTLSYKLQFQITNNSAEYEAFILGMKETKDLGVEQMVVFGDSELIIQQVRDLYKVKNVKLKKYRNEVWSLIEQYFPAFNLNHISREINELADSLAIAASNFKVILDVKAAYAVQIKHRPSIPDNIKCWQVFEDNREIKKFFECME